MSGSNIITFDSATAVTKWLDSFSLDTNNKPLIDKRATSEGQSAALQRPLPKRWTDTRPKRPNRKLRLPQKPRRLNRRL
jgi:hypothetical protein